MPQYFYKITIQTKEDSFKLLGDNTFETPIVTDIAYNDSKDGHVLEVLTENLPNVLVDKCIWRGEELDEIKWIKLR